MQQQTKGKKMKIKFVDARPEYEVNSVDRLKHLNRGDVIINAFHSPYNLAANVGVYLVVKDYYHVKEARALDLDVFAINLRKSTPYTYQQMLERFSKSGFYMSDIESLNVSVRKNRG